MNLQRAAANPLIRPHDVRPTRPDMEVIGAFNPAATRFGDETLLLLRVAEAVRDVPDSELAVPMVDCRGDEAVLRVERILRDTPHLDLSDTRMIRFRDRLLLTSLSHLRLARSRDGIHFTIEDVPALYPRHRYEEYGIEDPRITCIEGTYFITYTAVSRWGIAVGLASTTDFITYHRHGLIFGPENKDVVLFPARIGDRFFVLHRPSVIGLGELQIWLASSPDLYHWGRHTPLLSRRHGYWDALRIGAGDVPVRTEHGWLTLYHGVNAEQGYCLGAALLDLHHPSRIIARSVEPVMIPEAKYECSGFFDNVVFTCGSVLDDAGMLHIYYGAADAFTCRASVPVDDMLAMLECPRRNFSAA
ncbi:MAG: Beta-1,4-mannooligosaccharide phosphorylase [bacterium ADurb.Bin429]|nr:MAG: Beta-1,4-mannooligosaccharide phosphorylase [bacterium ADurb.Bin429]